MNKYQEALKDLCMGCEYNPILGECTRKCNEKEVFKELVDKTKPKKAMLVHDYDGYVYECPNCHNEFRPDYIMNHIKWNGCPYCLQKLDWSDEDE